MGKLEKMLLLTFACLFVFIVFQYKNRVENTNSEVSKDIKRIAITFDDGPEGNYTKQLLDGLKERGVKATFFVLGKSIVGNEDLILRMYEEGHLIGNHTYNHVELDKENDENGVKEIERTNEIIKQITGYEPEFIRPPFGAWRKEQMNQVDMFPVMWTIDPLDWKYQNTEYVVNHILNNVKDGDIILLHDIFETSVEAALIVIDRLQEQGYEFVTVDELMLD